MAIETIPLSPALGVEIRGVDLSRRIDSETFRAIHDAWLAHNVILFREQDLSTEDQVRFGSLFGTVERARTPEEGDPHTPRIKFIANRLVEGKRGMLPHGPMQFHTDHCFHEEPYKATILFAIEVPSRGGNTLLVNTYRAYETLPADLRDRIVGLEALNVYDTDADATGKTENIPATAPRAVHPIVIVHPETGRRALYVGRLTTHRIVGLAREESDAILERLIPHTERAELIYEHVWRRGDLLMWDNRCTLHGRTDFDPSEPRIIRRITLRGERPTPAPRGVQASA